MQEYEDNYPTGAVECECGFTRDASWPECPGCMDQGPEDCICRVNPGECEAHD